VGGGAEPEKPRELIAEAAQVLAQLLSGKQGSVGTLARGVADETRAAAQQHDGPVAVELQVSQQHDRHQVAELQAGRRSVEAAVGGDRSLGEMGLEARRRLLREAAPVELLEEIG